MNLRSQMNIRTESEFCLFIDTMRQIGIPVGFNYQLEKDKWQKIVSSQGYDITSLACLGISIGSVTFVFSKGQPQAAVVDGEERAYGPEASFMFAYDSSKSEVISRRRINGDGNIVGDSFGLDAMASQYDFDFSANLEPVEKQQDTD